MRAGITAAVAGLVCSAMAGQTAPAPANAESPQILRIGVELRGRLERETGFKFNPGPDDTSYLHRLRINAALQPSRWFRVFLQAQDARVAGFSRAPVPSNFSNALDLRQAYVEAGRAESGSGAWAIRAGRQELRFGDTRLFGPGDWSNTGRSWDAVRLAFKHGPVRLDTFAAALVAVTDHRFDRPRLQNGVYGLYSSTRVKTSVVDTYLFWKTNSRVRAESGATGDLDVYTTGMRAAGRITGSVTYGMEVAFQTGHYATDRIHAWAGHWRAGWALPVPAWSPEVILEYDRASGDPDPRDGRHGTFDQLYPSNREKYGTADRITWRNMHDLRTGIQVKPAARWRIAADLHNFWLATRADGLYTDSGRIIAINPAATSSYIGPETDVEAAWQVTPRLQLSFGYAHLFAGAYLRQTIAERGSSYPYVMWTYRFETRDLLKSARVVDNAK